MFKFNFSSENEETAKVDDVAIVEKRPVECEQSVKIEVTNDQYATTVESLKTTKVNCFVASNEIEIGYLENSSLTDDSDSDLIPRVYEGGFKIWECTQDLADLLTSIIYGSEFKSKTVCDLGCSAGVLGIIALIGGAKKVDFQDYNKDVIEKFTVPNVILSCDEREKPEDFDKCAFYSGDWDSFRELTLSDEKYDIIMTSETIYNPENYLKLLNFFKSRLSSKGKVFLSAKSYYFGVSGNILDFCKLLESDATFSFDVLKKITEGVQREILQIKFAT